jgi:UDP-glucuronate 4-epimerase
MGKYIVTGAAGFIGAKVSEFLIKDGHTVVGIDDLNDSYDPRLKTYRLGLLKPLDGFTFYQKDITDMEAMQSVFAEQKNINGIINLAARAGVRASVENPWAFVNTNLVGTLNLLEMSRQHQINKFVLASTSSIYGADAPQPTSEEADSSHPLQPYSASKKGAEAICHSYHFLYGIDVTIFRYFTVYGPAGRPDMVMFRFVQWINEGKPLKLNGDGEQSRGFTYVDDIARGTILGLKPLGYEIINLGGHEVISINAMIQSLENMIGKKSLIEKYPFHRADMMTNWANIDKARKLLGWEPKITLQEGMARLVDWYKEQRSWTNQVLTP